MRVDIGMKRHANKEDRVKAMIRRATTMASTRYTISGRKKEKGGARPVSLPKLKFSDLPE